MSIPNKNIMKPKISRYLARLFGTDSKRLQFAYLFIFILCVVELCIGFRLPLDFDTYPDAKSYISASYNWERLIPDEARTPIYPLTISLCRFIFEGDTQYKAVYGLQCLSFVISIFYLIKLSHIFGLGPKTTLIPTALYSLLPATVNYMFFLLTEGFCISFIIFFIWALVVDYPNIPTKRSAIVSGIWLFILIYLRPAMLCMLPVYIIYNGVILYRHRTRNISVVSIPIIVVTCLAGSLLLYKSVIQSKYSIDSLTRVTITNNYYTARESLALKPSHTKNAEFKKFLQEHATDKPFTDTGDLDWSDHRRLVYDCGVSREELASAVENAFQERPMARFTPVPSRLYRASNMSIYSIYPLSHLDRFLREVLRLDLFCFMFLMAICTLLLMTHKASMPFWILWLSIVATFGLAIIGAPAEWPRLTTPVYSLIYLLVTAMCKQTLSIRKNLSYTCRTGS